MCKWTFACGALGLALAASAESAIEVTSVVQDATTKAVRVAYTLTGDAAIVTVDVKTNGVSIGAKNLWHFRGDVHRLVQPGSRTAIWQPDLAWPGHAVDAATFELKAWSQATPPDYMVVDLLTPTTVNYYTCADELPGGLGADIYREDKVVMRHIPAENVIWRMGSPSTEYWRRDGKDATWESAAYVKLTSDYWIGVFEFTQRQYLLVMGTNTSVTVKDKTENGKPIGNAWHCPANSMTFTTLRDNTWPADGSTNLSSDTLVGKIRATTGVDVDLPTEAQWEFACRAGCGSPFYDGGDNPSSSASYADLPKIGWCDFSPGIVKGNLAEVGLLQPNDWGLYDMSGNVWELCLDWEIASKTTAKFADVTASGVNVNPTGAAKGSNRVRKGGSTGEHGNYLRSGAAHRMNPTSSSWQNGFRLVAPIGLKAN